MTAIACLKVFVGEEMQFADADTLAALVAKVAGAYLETTWVWPRRYGLVAPFSFVLADPRATALDARELQKLAADLQFKLFGEKGSGDIALLMFEGDQTDVMRFASTNGDALKALLTGEDDGLFVGRICKITPQGVFSIAPPGGPVEGSPPAEALAAIDPVPPRGGADDFLDALQSKTGWWGIYYLDKERFVGSGADFHTGWDARFINPPEGDDTVRNLACLEEAPAMMETIATGYLFLPFSFSAMVKPSLRETYRRHVERLPKATRPRLAASVQDVPREPSYGAITQIRTFLQPHFSMIDLHVKDPGFRIEGLPIGAINSVTLVLDGRDERARLAAISRFLKDMEVYRAKRVWQGVTGVQSLKELDLCRRLKAPFLSGPMVAPLADKPVGGAPCSSMNLPYRNWAAA